MSRPLPDNVRAWLAQPLPREVETPLTRLSQAEGVARVAVMPDVHFAKGVCIGTVVATRHVIYPEAVGGDIGCGVLCLPFEGSLGPFLDQVDPRSFYGYLRRRVPGLRHASRKPLPESLCDESLEDIALANLRERDGQVQFGTLGRGNHFLELQRDEEGRPWLMVHSGSRAMGGAIRDAHLARAQGTSRGLRFLEVDSPAGRSYLRAADWAVRYAMANRLAMAHAMVEFLASHGLEPCWDEYFDAHHNHVRSEAIDDERLWIHRKGALCAKTGELGAIPGSMGTHSFHVEGRGCASALHSSSHGAGREGSRTEARQRISPRQFAREMTNVIHDERMASRLLDEAPSAYRDIDRVMRAQRDLTRIVRKLYPVFSYKGA
ncbi:MAG: RtcB family protein [Planctomycetes bacterium]|nr:RtcB family protein [Planctomycetota bacterium]